jgi:steroid delta-isomerase-like uncharacterized protein
VKQRTRNITVILSAALVLAIGLFASCSSRQPERAADVKPNTPEAVAKAYQDCWTTFNEKRWDDFKKCYTPTANSQQPGYSKPSVTSPDAIIKASQDFAKTFPDARGEAQLILVNGNRIASMYLLTGTNTGPILGPDGKEIRPTNRRIGLFFGHSVEMDPAGKVVKEIGVIDGVTLENQLGLLKMAGRPLVPAALSTPVIVTAKNDETEMKNVELEKVSVDAWNKHDESAVQMYLADDYTLHDMTQPVNQNKAQNAEMNRVYWKAFSDAKINTTSIWAAGDYVAVTATLTGTNNGEFPPLKKKATGNKVSIPFIDLFRAQDGKLKEEWLFFDSASFISQLGVK